MPEGQALLREAGGHPCVPFGILGCRRMELAIGRVLGQEQLLLVSPKLVRRRCAPAHVRRRSGEGARESHSAGSRASCRNVGGAGRKRLMTHVCQSCDVAPPPRSGLVKLCVRIMRSEPGHGKRGFLSPSPTLHTHCCGLGSGAALSLSWTHEPRSASRT